MALVLIDSSLPAKKQQSFKKIAARYIATLFDDTVQCCYITQNDTIDDEHRSTSNAAEYRQLFRWLTETKLKPIHWRLQRCYMMVCIVYIYI